MFKLVNNELSVYESRQYIQFPYAHSLLQINYMHMIPMPICFSLRICTFCNNYNLSFSLIYFKTKQDIQNLRYGFVATHFRSNQTNFQRSWLINKELNGWNNTTNSMFQLNCRAPNPGHYPTRSTLAWNIYDTLQLLIYAQYLPLIYVFYKYSQKSNTIFYIWLKKKGLFFNQNYF